MTDIEHLIRYKLWGSICVDKVMSYRLYQLKTARFRRWPEDEIFDMITAVRNSLKADLRHD